MNEELPFPYLVMNVHMRNERVIVSWENCHSLGHSISRKLYNKEARGSFSGLKAEILNLHKYMLPLLKSSIVNFTFCTTSSYDKYSKHVTSSEIDQDKQNKIFVRRKRITIET